jgi:polysaccharide chain length determinant protein (PEP-CTERM system associated)
MKVNAQTAILLEIADGIFARWWTVVAGICVGVAGALLALHFIPKTYEAQTKIFVARQRIPEDFVRTTVMDDMKLRMAALKESVLSRPYLEKIIEDNYQPAPQGEELELLVEAIRWKVSVSVRRGLFSISYRDGDPERAARVANALAQIYIDENAEFRASRAGEATKTLEALAESVLAKLTEKEEAILAYESEHPFETEENLHTNLRMRELRQRDLETTDRNLQEEEEQLEELLVELNRAKEVPIVSGAPEADDPYSVQLARLQRQLVDLQSHYLDEHPEIKAKKRELADFIRTNNPSANVEGGAPSVSPAVVQLHNRIEESRDEIERLKDKQIRLREDIRVADERIEATPIVQARLAELNKGYGVLLDRYRDYQSKVEAARGAQQMEEGRKGEQFEIIERAVPSSLPIKPVPMAVFGMYVAFGLAVFVGPWVIKRALSGIVFSQAVVNGLSDAPLLVSIPPLPTTEVHREARRRLVANFGFSALSAVALLAVVIFVIQT